METKLSAELSEMLRQAEETDPQQEVPVIVTLQGDADATELERRGLRISHRLDFISAVSGTAQAAAVQQIAQSDSVARIEYDGEVHGA